MWSYKNTLKQFYLGSFPQIVLTLSLFLTLILVGVGVWSIWDVYRDFTISENEDLRLQELSGDIVYFDEVLTMTARLGAATGDPTWEHRYKTYEPKLAKTIQAAKHLAPEAFETINITQTEAANNKLVEMETRAFDLIREGNQENASQILFGQDYEEQKQIYAEGIKSFISGLQSNIQLKLKLNNERVFKFGLLSIVCLLITWSCALILIRIYFTKRRLFKAKEEAERISQAKSEFLSRMSHELRTPMNAILGYSYLLKNTTKEPLSVDQAENVEQIQKSGTHLLELINDVLDLSRIESGNMALSLEPVDVCQVVEEVLAFIKPFSEEKGIAVINELDSKNRFYVLADLIRLKQVLMNLVSNGIKYNREGGSVILSCEKMTGSNLKINVADTGQGIPKENQAFLFEPFARFHEDYSEVNGIGIGLALSKEMIVLMNGSIDFTSRPKGSCFSIELPNCDPPLNKNQEGTGSVVSTVWREKTPGS